MGEVRPRCIRRDKGLPIKQYEPFFSATWALRNELASLATEIATPGTRLNLLVTKATTP